MNNSPSEVFSVLLYIFHFMKLLLYYYYQLLLVFTTLINNILYERIYKYYKIAALCHNRALQDLYPTSYRLLFTTGSFTLTTSTFSNEPDVQRVQRVRMEG